MTAASWHRFKADPSPLTQIRPLHKALQDVAGKRNVPGVMSLYKEVQMSGTVLGVRVLRVGTRIYAPRAPLVAVIEGTWWGPRQDETDTEDEVTE